MFHTSTDQAAGLRARITQHRDEAEVFSALADAVVLPADHRDPAYDYARRVASAYRDLAVQAASVAERFQTYLDDLELAPAGAA